MEYQQRFDFKSIALSVLLTSMIAFPIVLSACSPISQEQAKPEEPEVILTCTVVGCSDSLDVELTGDISSDFIVEVKNQSGDVAAIHCLDDSPMIGSFQVWEYPLNAPEVEEVSQISFAPSLCSSDTGYMGYASKDNGDIQWIVVQCFEPKNYELVHSFPCDGQRVSFDDFAPDDATITVYWEGNAKTEKVTPSYYHWRPNGPDCEPECRSSTVTIEIP